MLFTKKEQASPPFLAVAAKFRDQLRFNVLPITEKNPSQSNTEVMEELGVKDLPKLVIV